jgi:hypothetical protein
LVLTVQAASHLEPVFEPVIEKAGFKLVRLRIMGGASKTLQVMAERPDGSMDVEGCSQPAASLAMRCWISSRPKTPSRAITRSRSLRPASTGR